MRTQGGEVYECKARGVFRKRGVVPVAGDTAVVVSDDEHGFVIDELRERKNILLRPFVANIDNLVIVLSSEKPKPDFLLCDKLIVSCALRGIHAIICVNKLDKASKNMLDTILNDYAAFDIVCVSALDNTGIDTLKSKLKNSTSAFAGQSAAGKSSVLNAICPEINLKTGAMSKKTARGKHTTRHVELIYNSEINGYVVDTPGFSVFDALDIEKESLKLYYPEFSRYENKCRFTSCIHIDEPDCAVKQAVLHGDIPQARYERYKNIIQMLKEKGENKYD